MHKALLRALLLGLAGTMATGINAKPASGPASQLIYFGTRISGANGVIVAARLDPATGALTGLGTQAHVDRPTWVIPSPHRPVLYANSETGNDGASQGRVISFTVDRASGALTELSNVPSGGGGATHITINGKAPSLLVSNYGTGQVAVLPLKPGGHLLPPSSVVTDTGSGPSPRQKSPHAHGTVIDPSGKFVLVTDLGADRIFIYRFNPATMSLSGDAGTAAALPPGSGPRHAVFSKDGRFLYSNNELRSELVTWRWNGTAGTLSPLNTQSTRLPGATGDNGAGELLLARDGRFLYASNRGDDSLVVYRLDPATGLPTEVQRIGAIGSKPWAMAWDNTGRWLVVANEASGTINVFGVDTATGLLTPTTQSLAVPHASSVAVIADDHVPASK